MGQSAALDHEHKVEQARNAWPDWFEHDARWLTAQRVVASRHFVRSRLLAKFLLHIVAETLEDRKANITEHRIGILVFDRPPSYSSIEDNIVRTYARQLRRRLAEYFAEEGSAEPLHIDIPLGGYAPIFTPAPTVNSEEEQRTLPGPIAIPEKSPTSLAQIFRAQLSRAPRKRRLLFGISFVVYSAILVCASWFAATRLGAMHHALTPLGPAKPLWAALFDSPANCYIVPADAGFNILEDLSHRPLSLAYYVKGSYLDLPLPQVDDHSAEDLHTQQFTSFTDLQIVTALAQLPEFNPQRAILRFPRQLQLDDLKDSNAIILGSMGSNPWASIAESSANFRIVNGEAMQAARIVNTKPEPGEAASYVSQWEQPAHETYAIIAYLPNLSGNGHLLLLQGLDVAGTQAAAETLIHPAAIASILQRATRPDGSLRPFEILLRSSSIESKSAGAAIIGSRVY
jgi:hypothetical protein